MNRHLNHRFSHINLTCLFTFEGLVFFGTENVRKMYGMDGVVSNNANYDILTIWYNGALHIAIWYILPYGTLKP